VIGHYAPVTAVDPALLWRLVDENEIDHVFELVSVEDMAAAWLAEQRLNRPPGEDIEDDNPYWWALELWWTDDWSRNRERVRAGLLALVDAAATDFELRCIGAGPLESFVSDDGDDLVWLEQQCAVNPKMRVALADVWCDAFVSAQTLARLDQAAGVRLARRDTD
jgi:hypothetical protein